MSYSGACSDSASDSSVFFFLLLLSGFVSYGLTFFSPFTFWGLRKLSYWISMSSSIALCHFSM
jgi:hypothetical protein